uniref:Protein phosphatase 2C like domain containing 1 n=1 Tax=Urocitellus parryii TaxID=9999 RepID=A0A8D2HZD0_UROPR
MPGILAALEAEAGGWQVQSQPQVFWKTRKWNEKTSTFESDNVSVPRRKKQFKKAKLLKSRKQSEELQEAKREITFPCSLCKQEIVTTGIFFHKKQHAVLATLDFPWMGGRKPPFSVLDAQRQFIISQLLSSFEFNEKILQNINNAFELLEKRQIPLYYKIIDYIDGSSVSSPHIPHLLIKGVAICGDRNAAWKVDMNDKFTVMNNFGNKPNVCFFGLFDGHHGAAAADLASAELPILLLHQLSKFDPSYQMTTEQQEIINSFHTVFREEYTAIEDLFSSIYKKPRALKYEYEDTHKAFAKAFWRMDRLLRLGRNEVSRVRWSGCSAVTCILEGSIKNPHVNKNWKGTNNWDGLSKNNPSQMMPQIISGVLHIANAGNVQAVLCRNGKGFCLTKEHTTRNIKERRRVLQTGAVISSNEPYGLLEGQIKTTRGLGFHGNLKLKKSIIPAPQTISIPMDDLCQFLILATNGLWEVLDKKEVTAMVITMFHMYKETYTSITQLEALPSTGNNEFESDIHILFQCESESEEYVSTTNSKNSSDYSFDDPKNEELSSPTTTSHENEIESVDDEQTSIKKLGTKNFYEGAAEYISHKLVNAALEAGSRDNITVMVIFLSGSEYHLLP